jgi:lytic murein transglycosylase
MVGADADCLTGRARVLLGNRKMAIERGQRRRRWGAVAAAILAIIGLTAGFAAPALSANVPTTQDDGAFARFIAQLWPVAQKAGVTRAIFETAFAGITADPALAERKRNQPEFNTPIPRYLSAAISEERTRRGRAVGAKWRRELAAIEQEYGVAAEIVLAILGMESGFSAPANPYYVVRSLATLAASEPPGRRFSDELIAALLMLQNGVPPSALQGSWAGAMGYPQFMPSTYLKYAVSFDGREKDADIWKSVPDSLASIANFLKLSGWVPGLSWGYEVTVPTDFDYRSLHESFAQFAARGFQTTDARALPHTGTATLYFPAGAAGPAVLLSENYWIIKQYNNSDAYALSVALLSDRLAGRSSLRTPWPASLGMLDRDERIKLQEDLNALGLYHGIIDGKLGPSTRDAVHDFQLNNGIPVADGFASPELFRRVEKAAR